MNTNDILDQDLDDQDDQYTIELTTPLRFILFSLLGFGLYGFWWCFKAWRFFKQKDNLKISPPWRAILFLIFMYPLFQKIKNYAKAQGHTPEYSSALLFLLIIATNLLSELPDPWWLVSFLSCLGFIPALRAFNYAVAKDGFYRGVVRQSFSTRQIILIIFGVIAWGLALLGFLVPTEPIYN